MSIMMCLAACTAVGTMQVEAWDGSVAARSDALLRMVVIDKHKSARNPRGLEPLHWNDRLADSARSHARRLIREMRFEHEHQDPGDGAQGENLFIGSAGGYAYGEMIDAWIARQAPFRPGRFPAVSTTGRWHDVGHFSQMIWPTTREIGCALASNDRHDILVCRYWPAGNVVGLAVR